MIMIQMITMMMIVIPLIMDFSNICDKLDNSEEENEPFRVSNCIEMKNYVSMPMSTELYILMYII